MKNNYKMSNLAIDVLIELEGKIDHVYKDKAGFLTIGVGHLLSKSEIHSGKIHLSNGNVLDFRNGTLSDDDIKELLRDDLLRYEHAIRESVKVPITQEHFDALSSFVFNIGITAFKNSTLLRLLNKSQYSKVPFQLKRWNKAGGRVIKGLIYRRNTEVAMWNTYRNKNDYENYA
jgi:lysozyme